MHMLKMFKPFLLLQYRDIIFVCPLSLTVRLREPSIFPFAGSKCQKSLRVLRERRETRPLLRQEPNVGMKSDSATCVFCLAIIALSFQIYFVDSSFNTYSSGI